MSLTSLLNEPEFFNIFDKEYGNHPALSAPLHSDHYYPPLTKNYALVGTAFDYLFRFYLGKLNNAKQGRWVAQHSLRLLGGQRYEDGRKADWIIDEARYSIRHNEIEKWPLLCLKLARLDWVYRHGEVDFSPLNKKDVKDLERLANGVKWSWFRGDVIFNPTFNEGSRMVGGADADFIIDDMLVDIKTTKYLKFTKEMFYQLIGYKMLADFAGITNNPDRKIKKIGVYFSRHAYLYIIDDIGEMNLDIWKDI